MIITSRAGQTMRHRVSDGTIAYHDHSTPSYATATSIAKNAPNCPAGALLIAYVFARSAVTPPAGWTLITSKTCSNAAVASQELLVYARDSRTDASAALFTWTQATSGRMGVGYVSVTNDNTATRLIPAVLDRSSSSNINSTTTQTIASNVLTAGRTSQEMFLMFATVIAVSGTFSPTVPSGSTTICLLGAADNRLAGAYQTRTPGQSNGGGNFVFGGGSADNGLATITLRIIGGF